jgi:hypothetical protein
MQVELFVMTMGRFPSILTWAILFNCLLVGVASASFFGFGADEKGKSGLDFNRGYDVNTVATVSGRVTALPHQGDRDQYVIEVKSGTESVTVSVGPGAFWEKKGIPIQLNDEISAKGSKAQGQDGKSYLLTQKLMNRTTGGQLELRSEKGEPVWSGHGAGRLGQNRSLGGQGFRGGGMMRGGGGGMMRH